MAQSLNHPTPLFLTAVGGWQYKKKRPGDGVVTARLVTPASAAGEGNDERFKQGWEGIEEDGEREGGLQCMGDSSRSK